MSDQKRRDLEWSEGRRPGIDRLLEGFRREMERLGTSTGETLLSWEPAVDIAETPEGWRVHADLPGLAKEEIRVSLEENVLTIQGERRREKTGREGRLLRAERSYGSFERRFELPGAIDREGVTARYENGSLEVFVPKAVEERSKARKVEID